MIMNNELGLSKTQIRRIIQQHMDKNADLLIGVDDPEVNEMINVLLDAFAEVIHINNKELSNDIDNVIENIAEKGICDALGRRNF